MRRITLALVLVLLCTVLGGCSFFPRRTSKQTTQPNGSAMIQGLVVDDAYRPLPGASVTVMGLQQTVLTGPDGKYTLTGLSGDVQNIIVQKEQYLMGVVSLDFSSAASRVLSTAPTLRLLSTEGSLHMDSTRIPVIEGKGRCAQCHQLHTPTDYLPVGGMNDSCYKSSCHSATKAAGRFPDRTVFGASPHTLCVWPGQKGGAGNCGSCHEPHGIVNTPAMLRLGEIVSGKRSTNNLCFACHENIGTGNAAGWPGKSVYVASTNKHNAASDPTGRLVNGDCLLCHLPHGRSGDPEMLRQNTNSLCLSCHTDKISASSGHNGNCLMCHDPHDVGASSEMVRVKHPNGTKSTLTKESYRGASLIPNSYCRECHKSPAPAGFSTAKDPSASTTRFKNSSPLSYQTDTNLHSVHIGRLVYSPWTWWTGSHDIVGGDLNKVRCAQCHKAHQTSLTRNIDSNAIRSFSGAYRGGYSGDYGGAVASKSGCTVAGRCHSCDWCHDSPGSPQLACYSCNYSDAAHSHNDAGIGGHPAVDYNVTVVY